VENSIAELAWLVEDRTLRSGVSPETWNGRTASRLGWLEEFEKGNQLRRKIFSEIEVLDGERAKHISPTSIILSVHQQNVGCLNS
jgi:hypothetical protein